ncbi:MAG: hypothetical protein EXS05_17455 [Planctomycetaceae bacterium]|nr:hypothetical protein [Planctomycetaceae bacterium]
MPKHLARFRKRNQLIEINRETITEEAVLGFVVDYSKELILIWSANDFVMDGFEIVATKDITSIDFGECEQWYEHVLRSEGLVDEFAAPDGVDLSSWKTALAALNKQGRNVIVENELSESERFLIGRVTKLTMKSATLQVFDPAGNWEPTSKRINYSDITLVSFDGNYVKMHTKYLRKPK